MYEADAKGGRPSIVPEKLLRAMLIQVLHSVRSERQLMEQVQYNLLITLDKDAQEALKDNLKFSAKKLQETLESALDARKLLAQKDDSNAMQLNVEITGVRVRSNFSAVMFGFMAGSDYVNGNVSLLDPENRLVDRFKVSTSYALGGLAGGQDEARMGWLYEKFAEKTFSALQPE
jgi:hypothetical protein